MGRSAGGAVAAQPSRPSCPPGRLLKPRLRLQAAMSETHSWADHALWRSHLTFSRVEERRVAGRGRWLIRRFRNRAAGRVPWVRFLPPLSEPGGPISGTGLSSGIMRLARGLPGHDQRTGLASPGTRLAPLSRPAGASSGLLTPWRRRPLGSSPSFVHVMTSGIPAHLRGDRPSATPVSLLPFAIAST